MYIWKVTIEKRDTIHINEMKMRECGYSHIFRGPTHSMNCEALFRYNI